VTRVPHHPAKVVIRPISARDETAWRSLFAAYNAFYETTLPDDLVTLTWQRLLAGADGMVGLVAETGGVVRGLTNLVFHRSTWSATSYCYLEDLFVDSDARGRGLATALIEAAYAEADKRGAERTYWATKADNAAARCLYDRVGELTPFVQYRRRDGS
jgi:GNAT superfamily N-acetyltransferase